MTETRFTWQWLFVVAGIGVVVGLVVGLLAGWIVLPAGGPGVDVSALNAGDQNDYIVLVANSYAYDSDLPRARQRLSLLKDPNVNSRLERLAKALDTRQDPSASNVATLAIALGSKDSSLQVLAATVASSPGGSPTKFAQVEVEPTATSEPTQPPTDVPEATATNEPTERPTKVSQVVATKSTPRAAATTAPTAAPQPAAALVPEFNPAFPDAWPTKVQYLAASVTPGQQYWRLKFARFCDWSPDGYPDTCPGMPGGPMGITIYVMAIDQSGACVNNAKIKDVQNDGTVFEFPSDQPKQVEYTWNSASCALDWEKPMYGEGNTISFDGFPSDTLANLAACSRNHPPGLNPPPCGHTHVRYFLVFQLTTR